MIRSLATSLMLLFTLASGAQEFERIPVAWKWLSDKEAAFTFNGSYKDAEGYVLRLPGNIRTALPERAAALKPEALDLPGAVNPSYSPDSTKIAFTRDNDLYVRDLTSGEERRLTFDGSQTILNAYASWVYYEEILGRASRYKAFWWSPDSRKIGFYRFDNSQVPMFPIYSPKGQDGRLNRTRYPKAGETNPEVRIGIVPVDGGATVWADFDEKQDQYFGIPFWSADSKYFYIAREPRVQNTLDLYAVSAEDGSKRAVYHEEYKTWLDWLEQISFSDKGLYMVRAFETGWEQLYFLSYDGNTLRRLTDGPNWRMKIERVDSKKGEIYFTAQRDSRVFSALYRLGSDGSIKAMTDPAMDVTGVKFSPDGRHFIAALSNYDTPTQIWLCDTRRPERSKMVADMKGKDYDPSKYALPQLLSIEAEDGQPMFAKITYPKDFDPSRRYPVHMEIYGGPNTAYVRGGWRTPGQSSQWWSEHGIIHIVADCRAAGHTGRAGTDLVHKDLVSVPVRDFVRWAEYLCEQPYVDPEKIGVEGFSFGGTMTTMLLLTHSDLFHYGIAGGGVYDWMLYDSHYTERFMDTPQNNPEGYKTARVLEYVSEYPVGDEPDGSVMLKLTHGTGDDNVHFQNTLQLIDALQRAGKQFELMIYPDGMHGYRNEQGRHSLEADRVFWSRYLL